MSLTDSLKFQKAVLPEPLAPVVEKLEIQIASKQGKLSLQDKGYCCRAIYQILEKSAEHCILSPNAMKKVSDLTLKYISKEMLFHAEAGKESLAQKLHERIVDLSKHWSGFFERDGALCAAKEEVVKISKVLLSLEGIPGYDICQRRDLQSQRVDYSAITQSALLKFRSWIEEFQYESSDLLDAIQLMALAKVYADVALYQVAYKEFLETLKCTLSAITTNGFVSREEEDVRKDLDKFLIVFWAMVAYKAYDLAKETEGFDVFREDLKNVCSDDEKKQLHTWSHAFTEDQFANILESFQKTKLRTYLSCVRRMHQDSLFMFLTRISQRTLAGSFFRFCTYSSSIPLATKAECDLMVKALKTFPFKWCVRKVDISVLPHAEREKYKMEFSSLGIQVVGS